MTSVKPTQDLPVKMIKGTSGKLDYMVFAKNGGIIMGIKPNFIGGTRVQGKKCLHIEARIRSTEAGDLFSDDSNVVSLHPSFDVLTAWPNVTFEKHIKNDNPPYASTQISIDIEGDIEENPQMLYDQLIDKKLATSMAGYLEELVGGEDNLVITKDVLIDYLQNFFDPMFKKIAVKLGFQQGVEKEIANQIGVFKMTAASLKKVHDALPKDEPEDVEDEDEPKE